MTQSDIFSRYSRASLSLDSVGSQTDDESSNPSPASATATDSPVNGFPASGSTPPQGGNDIKLEGESHPSSPLGGLQSVATPGMKAGREKRKRSRVTSEQLAHLERAFQAERSPTAHDRRVLSAFLGMHERQTQIWFQNRRVTPFFYLLEIPYPRHIGEPKPKFRIASR
jgi:regulatory protein PHO2